MLLAVALVTVAAGLAGPAGAADSSDDDSGDSGPTYRQAVVAAVDDIQDYWADQYKDLYGRRYLPIPEDRIIAARPE